ncbi:hypothetical protein EXIGLDRAFT_90620 [Exidia glandulosa HHB12029]|uniref:Uncharacterized protein n=1 Tax=Exidia glandulosa HHB12029 TaxID=1314781 RepID=A0A166AGX1_EXIGL|nr:hypothetical protein EXIGLDRAFT_90620 [Exidia glandulosa HHB12029]
MRLLHIQSLLAIAFTLALPALAQQCTTRADCHCPAGTTSRCGGAFCFDGECSTVDCVRTGQQCP